VTFLWWKFVHLVGVFGFLTAHGISAGVALRLRRERDPLRVLALGELSQASITWLYVSLLVLITGGVVAGFQIHAWGQGWIWVSLGLLVAVSMAMYPLGTNYYRKVRFVAKAMAEGSRAVTGEEFVTLLRSPRPFVLAGVGFGAIGFILYLMVLKPF
jgi:uncharacterized membrane protein